MLKRRKIHIACLQETRWNGTKARELGEGYKLFYSGSPNHRNGVGIVLSESFKDKVVEVKRCSDRLMWVKIADQRGLLTVMCAYAPQIGCMESEKNIFFDSLEKEMQGIGQEKKLIIGADFNAHIGKDRLGYERNHGGYGHGLKNKEGEKLLQVSQAYDMAIVNTYFQKREDHIVTYRSGKHFSQIDYLLIWRKDLWRIKDC
ncbi:craniofacial development protein 2-like [Gordionus sp. m RMFG-2023]|uniref:craniofacial development protein 2-like n=1 Tax=Gordionus sp. m RMFG-2023 TaxID=3053472 RepID=UPI0031FD11E6